MSSLSVAVYGSILAFKSLIAFLSILLIGQIFRRWTRSDLVVAFFHPYCNSGGGGERVLWVAVSALLTDGTFKNGPRRVRVIIYTGDVDFSPDQILANVETRFGITFSNEDAKRISFVYIKLRTLLEAHWYPVATMLWQCIGSLVVGAECMTHLVPDVYIDTTGAAFTYPLIKLVSCGQCLIMAYVHYPIISSDMLQKVREMRPSHNNAGHIASSTTVSSLKLIYYHAFAAGYSGVGQCADSVLVNSTWTRRHIESLWGVKSSAYDDQCAANNDLNDNKSGVDVGVGSSSNSPSPPNHNNHKYRLSLVYPPCNTEHILKSIPMPSPPPEANCSGKAKKRYILSIGQFRPEKDHFKQIKALKLLRDKHPDECSDVVLVILGSTRNIDDEKMVMDLRQYVRTVTSDIVTVTNGTETNGSQGSQSQSNPGLPEDAVEFVVNQKFSVIEHWMREALVGIHTMWNEHFGISVVEMLAAGMLVIAHKSGGPLADIISPARSINGDWGGLQDDEDASSKDSNGFLAENAEEYAIWLADMLAHGSSPASFKLRERARQSTHRFSDEKFTMRFCSKVKALVGGY